MRDEANTGIQVIRKGRGRPRYLLVQLLLPLLLFSSLSWNTAFVDESAALAAEDGVVGGAAEGVAEKSLLSKGGTKATKGGTFFKGRQSLGAVAAPGRSGLKGLIKDAGLPHTGRVRFVPKKNALNTGIRTNNGGFIDRFGNVWRRPRGQVVGELHWDVQLSKTGKTHFGWASKSGSHINVSLDGRIVH